MHITSITSKSWLDRPIPISVLDKNIPQKWLSAGQELNNADLYYLKLKLPSTMLLNFFVWFTGISSIILVPYSCISKSFSSKSFSIGVIRFLQSCTLFWSSNASCSFLCASVGRPKKNQLVSFQNKPKFKVYTSVWFRLCYIKNSQQNFSLFVKIICIETKLKIIENRNKSV